MLLGTPSDLGVGLPLLRRDVGNEYIRVHFHRSLLAYGTPMAMVPEIRARSATVALREEQHRVASPCVVASPGVGRLHRMGRALTAAMLLAATAALALS